MTQEKTFSCEFGRAIRRECCRADEVQDLRLPTGIVAAVCSLKLRAAISMPGELPEPQTAADRPGSQGCQGYLQHGLGRLKRRRARESAFSERADSARGALDRENTRSSSCRHAALPVRQIVISSLLTSPEAERIKERGAVGDKEVIGIPLRKAPKTIGTGPCSMVSRTSFRRSNSPRCWFTEPTMS